MVIAQHKATYTQTYPRFLIDCPRSAEPGQQRFLNLA